MRLMDLGSQGHKPSAILPEKHACALYKKLGELQSSETMERRGEKFLAPIGSHSTNVPTSRIEWENKRRILNLWMEINGMRTSTYKEYTRKTKYFIRPLVEL
jgi:hypothetical protein